MAALSDTAAVALVVVDTAAAAVASDCLLRQLRTEIPAAAVGRRLGEGHKILGVLGGEMPVRLPREIDKSMTPVGTTILVPAYYSSAGVNMTISTPLRIVPTLVS